MANHKKQMTVIEDTQTGERSAVQMSESQLKEFLRKNPHVIVVARG